MLWFYLHHNILWYGAASSLFIAKTGHTMKPPRPGARSSLHNKTVAELLVFRIGKFGDCDRSFGDRGRFLLIWDGLLYDFRRFRSFGRAFSLINSQNPIPTALPVLQGIYERSDSNPSVYTCQKKQPKQTFGSPGSRGFERTARGARHRVKKAAARAGRRVRRRSAPVSYTHLRAHETLMNL
eukprot:1900153-Prymnesium_polylepis.1